MIYCEGQLYSNKYFMPKAFFIYTYDHKYCALSGLLQIFIFELVQYTFYQYLFLSTLIPSALHSSGRISSISAFCSVLAISSSAIFIYQTTNDAINLTPISERIGTFPKMTILSVQIQGYIARLFSIQINRKICITIIKTVIKTSFHCV